MTNKTVYLYDENTKEYTSSYEAQESPLEAGVFLTPEHSTEAPLIPIISGEFSYFNGVTWEPRADTRGTWFNVAGDEIEILDLLTVVNKTWTRDAPVKPPLTIEEKRALLAPLNAWQIRKVLTQSGLRKQVEDAVLNSDQNTQDAWHYATSFRRDDEILNGMALKLGISDYQLDSMFELGVTL